MIGVIRIQAWTLTSSENTQVEAHGVVLVCDEEEESVTKDRPDEDVGEDSGGQSVGINGGSTNSEHQNIGQSQRTRNNRDVDESGGARVSEVGSGKVEEVDDDQQLSEPEVGSDPEVDEAEEEEVAGDEVGAYIGGSVHVNLILRVQVPAVADLENVQDNHVDGGDDRVQGERSVSAVVLVPDGSTVVLALMRRIEGVVDAGDYKQEP